MKKFLNDPTTFVDDMLEGIYAAHPQVRFVADDKRVVIVVHQLHSVREPFAQHDTSRSRETTNGAPNTVSSTTGSALRFRAPGSAGAISWC